MKNGDYEKDPSLEEIVEILNLVLQKQKTREEVSSWAEKFVIQENPSINDLRVWEIIKTISGIDLKVSPNEYLHSEQDIIDWIQLVKEGR